MLNLKMLQNPKAGGNGVLVKFWNLTKKNDRNQQKLDGFFLAKERGEKWQWQSTTVGRKI